MISRLANLTEASQIIDYICMCTIYLFFYRALKAQGFNRKDLPYIGWAQPYCAWFGLGAMIFTVSVYGYTCFVPGCKSTPIHSKSPFLIRLLGWDLGTFFSYVSRILIQKSYIFLCKLRSWELFKEPKKGISYYIMWSSGL